MIGAIVGDIIGSPYEHHNVKRKNFHLFTHRSRFTDDTVMTIAVAQALMVARESGVLNDEQSVKAMVVMSMHHWGLEYLHAGYSRRFKQWLVNDEIEPYYSYGNGSAMRVSPAGWIADDIETTRQIARWTAEVTHNHPEGVKGAEAVASAIFLARAYQPNEVIKDYIASEFGYNLNRSCDKIRRRYRFDASCQGSVPEAITAFLEGKDFEDVIRNAVSLGGDSDTIAAIAGSIAEAFYGVPEAIRDTCMQKLPGDIMEVVTMWRSN